MSPQAQMRGTLTVPHASIRGADSYGRAIGVTVLAARLVAGGCELDVSAHEAALERLAVAQASGRCTFVPAALPGALRALEQPNTIVVREGIRGLLVRRRDGRAWCRELGVPVLAVERGKRLELSVVLPAGLIAQVAHEQAMGLLTFSLQDVDAVQVNLAGEQERALRWAASATDLSVLAGGYGLLVAAANGRMNCDASTARGQSSYAA